MSKAYLLSFPRPIGLEPTIYLTKPKIGEPEVIEVEPDYFMSDPFEPEILEFDNVFEAKAAIVRFNGTEEYLSQLKVKP